MLADCGERGEEGTKHIPFKHKPNWLKVERAIILLKSYSKLAPNPATNIVRLEKRRKTHKKLPKAGLKRISKYTPAVTKVEAASVV
jgi:hypothetical protein